MQGPLPLILLAAEKHPEHQFRRALWNTLNGWVNVAAPIDDITPIIHLLTNEKGTFLEPFELGKASLQTASFLARLALFNASNQASRFRVCSDKTIGNVGGLVITNNLASFYSEEFVLGRNRLLNSVIRFYAPYMSSLIPISSNYAQGLKAYVNSDDGGLFILIESHLLELVGWVPRNDVYAMRDVANKLAKHSTIGIGKTPVSELGLSFSVVDDGLKISPKSPEAIIRFSSYLVQGQKINLSGLLNYDLQISLPREGQGDAPITIVANDGFALQWMNVEDLGFPNLELHEIEKIRNWAFDHSLWQNNPAGET